MTALAAGYKPTLIPGPRHGHRYQALVKSGEIIFNGAVTAKDASTGKWVEATSTDTGQIVHGVAELGDVDSFDNSAGTNTNEMFVDACCPLLVGSGLTSADEGKIAYVSDDQTFTLVPGGPILGIVQLVADSTHAYVMIDPLTNKGLAQAALLGGGPAFKCRCVVTSLPAGSVTAGVWSADATGVFGAQDGVTTALNDVIFVQEGTTNLDNAQEAGPWQITTLGAVGVTHVMQRPSWWAHGAPIVPGAIIEIGGEGTGTNPNLAGTEWKSFAAKAKTVGTDAPVFWPRKTSCAVTLASGTLASARQTMPVRALLSSDIVITSNPTTAPHANTRAWRASAVTAGVTGTASVQIVAESAPGTTNASDVGQYNIAVFNW